MQALVPLLLTRVMPSCPWGLQRAVLQLHCSRHRQLAEGDVALWLQWGQWVRAGNVNLPLGLSRCAGRDAREVGLNQPFFT